jgi:hypothetical protein
MDWAYNLLIYLLPPTKVIWVIYFNLGFPELTVLCIEGRFHMVIIKNMGLVVAKNIGFLPTNQKIQKIKIRTKHQIKMKTTTMRNIKWLEVASKPPHMG